jgi:hypothetical protein
MRAICLPGLPNTFENNDQVFGLQTVAEAEAVLRANKEPLFAL